MLSLALLSFTSFLTWLYFDIRVFPMVASMISVDEYEFRKWAAFACDSNGCLRLADSISFSWNKRLVTTLAQVWTDSPVVHLNLNVWGRLTKAIRREIVIHEVCHVIGNILYAPEGIGHGKVWKTLMRSTGLAPRATIELPFDVASIRPAKNRIRLGECGCRKHLVPPSRVKKMIKFCKRCGNEIKLIEG